MEFRLLVAGPRDPLGVNNLRLNGTEIAVYRLNDESGALPVAAEDLNGIVGNNFFLHHALDDFVNLQFVQLLSAGWDRFPVSQARTMGLSVYNAAGVYAVPMAEWLLGKTFELAKRSHENWQNQQSREWRKYRNLPELQGKSVAFFGVGRVAAAAAPRFRAMGMSVMGVSRRGPFEDANFDAIIPADEWEKALQDSDFVVCCLPDEPQTRDYFSSVKFSAMGDSTMFLNVSRGSVVDELALIAWLQNNPNSGAALDVYKAEPLPEKSKLWNLSNVLLTPHTSFESDQNSRRLRELTTKNLERYLHGRKGGVSE